MKSKLKNTLKVIGLILIIVSGSFILYNQIKKKLYIATEAVVVGIELESFIDGHGEKTVYAPIVSYSINDVQYQLKSSDYESVNGKSPHEIGDTIRIYVKPSNHKDFFVSSIGFELIFPLFWLIAGLILFLIGKTKIKKIKFDTTDNFETSKDAHWSIKYSLLIVGLYLLITGSQVENFDLGFISLTGYNTFNLVYRYVLILLGVLVIILFVILRKSFSILKFTDDNIYIRKYKKPIFRKINENEVNVEWQIKKEETLKWEDIKSIKMFYYLYPPTYLLSMKNTRKKYLFSTRDEIPLDLSENPLIKYLSLKKVVDKSILGEYLADKRNELNL